MNACYILAFIIFVLSIASIILNHKEKLKKSRPDPVIKSETKQETKEKEHLEKQQHKRQQAEADKIFYENQLNRVMEMLINLDDELTGINEQIRINLAMRSYDKNKKEEKRKTQVIKQIMVLENKIHTIESKLAKANYILQSG